ncbi:hypothetical protein J1792_31625 [Streptomyces triculaminicus]|uniref:Uncharacterized protein n=1 Tax=Streptomyces triculaminicus TaxID=2816232 RepID=A0A939FWB0_9ACTN|nr:hypothetical protein [Streptomyces triculaminicus]MBO0657112.1 hypothetical protein [Streptomyces triculaminicus]
MDSSALTGLIGALGGALIGAGAVVYGPLFLKRREHHQAAADGKRQQADEAMKALIDARAKFRLWLDYLVSTVAQAAAGVPTDGDAFEARLEKLANDASRAGYHLEYFRSRVPRLVPDGAYFNVTRSLHGASIVIRTALATDSFSGGSVPAEVMDELLEAEQRRIWFPSGLGSAGRRPQRVAVGFLRSCRRGRQLAKRLNAVLTERAKCNVMLGGRRISVSPSVDRY